MLSKSNNKSAADRSPWLDERKTATLIAYVERGGGLLAVHSGTAGYRESPAMHALLGGCFREHPERCPVEFAVTAAHPVVEGVGPFAAVDEHYRMDLCEPAPEILMTSAAGGVVEPACWIARRGAGRVCVVTPGHTEEVWRHPDFQRLLGNALSWCAR
jgi:type 1 glutamine amidotransferase